MNRLRSNRVSLLVSTSIATFALVLLVFPPMVGIADNGDFFRLMYWGKFEYPPLDPHEQYEDWINREYVVTRNPFLAWYGFPSSGAVFVKASAILNLFRSRDRFDIRFLGFIHVLAFAVACWLLLRGWRKTIGGPITVPVLGLLIVFCDLGYLAYFHSFYGEPASLIFLLAMTGAAMCLNANPAIGALIVFHLCAFCFVTAKPQNLPFAIPLALFSLWLQGRSETPSWRLTNISGIAVTLACGLLIFLLIPTRMRDANLYNSVFSGILVNSPAPRRDLTELGLPEEFEALKETNYFNASPVIDTNGDSFRRSFYDRVSALAVIRFYLTHPRRLVEKLDVTSRRAFTLRPPLLGNFEKQSGQPFGSKAHRWSAWSQAKEWLFPKSVWFIGIYFAVLAVLIAYVRRRERHLSVLMLLLWLMTLIAFVVPVIGDGVSDLEKHLFIFNAFFDLSVVMLASIVIRVILGGIPRRWSVVSGQWSVVGGR